MAFIGMKINSECKPVELTRKEVNMIKRINGYTRMAVIYFLAVVIFGVGAVALLFEGDINIIACIFFIVLALVFARIFYNHIHQNIEYAYYATVTKKEVRYGVPSGGRGGIPVPGYSQTVPQKTKEKYVKYDFVSVMIDGIEFGEIYCHYRFSKKIDVGSEIILAKGYNFQSELSIYNRKSS
ncbi:MAG: hypothetical protein NC340_03015 [Ruminococcus flavefaciens]|nr:hypothetical protein [Ruminococcus flavefaciens]MCM1229472.1 hypothetical protein [Ruminococcus flavefaciens]